MRFTQPAAPGLFDAPQTLGAPHTRIDGSLKVTGRATYAYEHTLPTGAPLVGYPVMATIAKGRITHMKTDAARAAPGVAAVITTLEIDELGVADSNVARLFGGNAVRHYHQAIGVVVAETFEQARAAANLIDVSYEVEKIDLDLEAAFKRLEGTGESEHDIGDFAAAFAEAEVTVDSIFRTPSQSHAMIEPHASIVDWSDDTMTVWTSNQILAGARKALSQTFGIPSERIRVICPFIGGGFGSKLWLRADAVLAALGSRETGQPVKVALLRAMIFNNTTHRSATIQRVRLGATKDGKLTAIGHEAASHTQPGGKGENATQQTPEFYAAPNRRIKHYPVDMSWPEASDMRAPGEAPGLMALEVAMDELAEKLGIDPVRLRVLNDTQINPSHPEQTFSDRNFVACLELGAERFGWASRNTTPGARREGDWLIGHGMAGAYRGAPTTQSGARVRLEQDRLVVETDMTEIGTGSYTILTQTAAETMGVPFDAIEVRLGDTEYPASSGSGGQFGAASASAGVYAACVALQEKIAQTLGAHDLRFAGGRARGDGIDCDIFDLAKHDLEAEDHIEFGTFKDKYVIATFGAHFVEAAVHAATGEIRVRRMLMVCDAGRILNPITARSQIIGGMTMGVGAALSEELAEDAVQGAFVNHDLAGYEIAVHADIPEQEVVFLDTLDRFIAPLKAKGVGELGVCGAAAAIANAIYNATGVRVRSYPITLDKLLTGLPPSGH